MPRVKTPKQLLPDPRLHYTEEDRRFATPEPVATYRAQRLQCQTLAELGCGAGFQTIAFAKTCQQVYAVEKDPHKIEHAKYNAQVLGLKNITFICGDALDPSVVTQLKSCEMVFCDTERLPGETRRTLDTLQPDPRQVLSTYLAITQNIAIEVPPHLSETLLDCEREYLSLNGKLNRLTLYFGRLKQTEKSVVLLPENERLIYTAKKPVTVPHFPPEAKYLYEINPAVVLAGLYGELDYAFFIHQEKPYAFSKDLKPSLFLRAYRILTTCVVDPLVIQKTLQQMGTGKVLLRYKIDPQVYWKERKQYEQGLSGGRKIHLFVFDQAVLCEEVDGR